MGLKRGAIRSLGNILGTHRELERNMLETKEKHSLFKGKHTPFLCFLCFSLLAFVCLSMAVAADCATV